MKVLLDACVWGGAKSELSLQNDVIWAGDWDEDPGDDEILRRAYREGRVLITLDKDLGNWLLFEECLIVEFFDWLI